MKNDVILALVAFIMSALIAWVSSLTIMVFDLDKQMAVHQVEQTHKGDK